MPRGKRNEGMPPVGGRGFFPVTPVLAEAVRKYQLQQAEEKGLEPSWQVCCAHLMYAGAKAEGLIADSGVTS